MKKKSQAIKIVFEGQKNQIDANTLVNFLTHYTNIVELSHKSLGDGTKGVTIKINAVEKGSFVILAEFIEQAIPTLFSYETISYLANLIGVVGGVFYLHQKLKGKPANEEDRAKAEKESRDKQIVINKSTINIYNQPVTREAISKAIATIDEDEAVEALRIDNNGKTAVRVLKEEFKELIYTDFATEKLTSAERRIVDENAKLSITRLSFESGAKWCFVYRGMKINIFVKNERLIKHINDGARFAKGDYIRVKLEILQRFNTQLRVYEDVSYKIIEFLEHARTPAQSDLFEKK